jgi:hypothetical protein
MFEKILVNRFSLDDPDWDLLDCDLPELLEAAEPEEEQERWLANNTK